MAHGDMHGFLLRNPTFLRKPRNFMPLEMYDSIYVSLKG